MAAGVCIATLVVLIGFIPYTIGYGSAAATMLNALWTFWNAFGGDWQHGMLVPVVVGWIVYRDRKYLQTLPIQGSALGAVVLFFGLAFYYAGSKADVIYFGYFGIHLFVAGAVLFFLGWAWIKALLFPLVFLAFMWPLLFLDNMLAFPLRLIMSEVSFHFLNMVGLSAIKVGSAIVSAPDFEKGIEQGAVFAVDIANPCSGIRSLFALMMISCIYGHLALRTPLQKVVLFALSLPFAVFGNFIRILMLTFGTIWFGAEFAIGSITHPSTFHMFAGFAVFAAALAGMVVTSQLLNRLPDAIVNLLGKGRSGWVKPN